MDFTIKFSKTFCKSYSVVGGKPTTREEYLLPYVILITDSLTSKKRYEFSDEAKSIPIMFFRLLVRDEDILDIDESFYEKSFVGWCSFNKNMKEFLTPTKVEELYKYMFYHMKDYTDTEGTLVLYFELV